MIRPKNTILFIPRLASIKISRFSELGDDNLFIIIITLQDPPPCLSFHHRVFNICNLPSSCNLRIAPFIAVL